MIALQLLTLAVLLVVLYGVFFRRTTPTPQIDMKTIQDLTASAERIASAATTLASRNVELTAELATRPTAEEVDAAAERMQTIAEQIEATVSPAPATGSGASSPVA